MAKIPMVELDLPDLPYTYTFTQLDDSETGMGTEGTAPDSHAVDLAIEELNTEVATKANKDGYYETLGAGYARQIQSSMYEEDNAAYNFRTAGGTAEIGELKNEKIVGGSLPWNQLVPDLGTLSSSGSKAFNSGTTKIAGHKYLFSANISADGNTVGLYSKADDVGTTEKILSYSVQSAIISAITTATSNGTNANENGNMWLYPYIPNGSISNIMFIDLTQMFGSTIADYIYALETANAGDGVAWFRRYFPKDYYAYHPVGFEHVQTNKHITTGFNQFDGTHNAGYWDVTDGSFVSGGATWAGSDYIPCFPNTNYYWKLAYSGSKSFGAVLFYGANKNYLGYRNTGVKNSYFATPNDCYYMTFYANKDWFDYDICINLHWDGERDGEYEAYDKHEYSIDDVVLRGIPKIDASGNLYFDGDTYESDGTVTRRYHEDEITECTSVATASTGIKYAACYISKQAVAESLSNNFLSTKYDFVTAAPTTGNKFRIIATQVYIFDERFTDKETADSILASEKPHFVYKVATPITEEADPYTDPMFVDNWGTEQFIDAGVSATTPTRDVEIPVGHETKYQPNLRAKIESTPDAPPSDGLWLVQMESGQASYVAYLPELPTSPTDDGNYLLKLTKSGSTVSLSWEAQE